MNYMKYKDQVYFHQNLLLVEAHLKLCGCGCGWGGVWWCMCVCVWVCVDVWVCGYVVVWVCVLGKIQKEREGRER